MINLKSQLLQILDAAIAAPVEKTAKTDPGAVPETPVLLPQNRHVSALLRFCSLPEKSTRTKLDELARKFRDELEVSARLEHPAFEHERQIALAVSGKIKPSEVITRTALREIFEQTHQIQDARAAKFSREAALIAADVLETALAKLPSFIAQLKTHESILHETAGIAPATEVFTKFEKRLAAHVRKLAKTYRENTTVSDPSELLK